MGRALALECARFGAKVVIGGRNVVDGNIVVDEINKKYKTQALFVKVNLSIVKDCEKLISQMSNFTSIEPSRQ